MSFETLSKRPRSAFISVFILAAIALSVTGLQVFMLWQFYPRESESIENMGASSSLWYAPWRRLLPHRKYGDTTFLSGVVFKGELILLVEHGERPSWPESADSHIGVSREIVRLNLSTHRLTTSPALSSECYAVTDGEKLWWLDDRTDGRGLRGPEYRGMGRKAFVWDGRPVEIIRSIPDGLYQLCEFVDGKWRELDEFLLLPDGFVLKQELFFQDGNNIRLLVSNVERPGFYYRTDLPIGTKQQAMEFADQHPWGLDELTDSDLDRAGWKRIQIHSQTTSKGARNNYAPFQSHPFGLCFENAFPCAMVYEATRSADLFEFWWFRYLPGEEIESKRMESPIRWTPLPDGEETWFKMITSHDGSIYIVSYAGDGRSHFLQLENGNLSLLAQRGSPLIFKEVVELGECVILTIAFPMLVLSLFTWVVQRFREIEEIPVINQTVTLASGLRRGIARSIDILIPLTLLLFSIVLHPDAIGWWDKLDERRMWLLDQLTNLFSDPSWGTIEQLQMTLVQYFGDLISAPFLWYFVVPAIVFYVVQLVQQARTGRTLGKWVMGVKVLRTTLRPCGLARSVLREILFLVDSVMLISWVPGVISILATSRSQRIGDLLADTIVVRDSAKEPVLKPVSRG